MYLGGDFCLPGSSKHEVTSASGHFSEGRKPGTRYRNAPLRGAALAGCARVYKRSAAISQSHAPCARLRSANRGLASSDCGSGRERQVSSVHGSAPLVLLAPPLLGPASPVGRVAVSPVAGLSGKRSLDAGRRKRQLVGGCRRGSGRTQLMGPLIRTAAASAPWSA